MYCPSCNQQIPDHLDACPACLKPGKIQCRQCKAQIPADSVFCSQCGTKLDEETLLAPRTNRPLQTQRRHLTVMFCDLVGSTGLSTQIDPEDLSEILIRYRDMCMSVIKKWDGYVADFQGDGVMIYFGYPRAHEDDSLRAVYAGLDIIDQISGIRVHADTHAVKLAVRIGINSGRSVIGDIGSGEIVESMGIVGETPNIASKLQSVANDNVIVISESTYRSVKGFFSVKYLGKQQIKGVEKQVRAYQVMARLDQSERFEGKRSMGLNRLTGRDNELNMLKSNWDCCERGEFLSMLVIGEAGIGKSRLLWSFRQWLKSRQHSAIVFNCSAYHTQTTLHPFIEMLIRGAGRDVNRWRRRLKILFRKLDCFDEATLDSKIDLLLDLVHGRNTHRDPKQYRYQIYEIFLVMAQSLSKRSPLLIVVEDLHWIDPTSMEFFNNFLSSGQLSNTCLIATSREIKNKQLPVDMSIELKPLDDKHSADLIEGIVSKSKLPDILLNQLVDSCNGNPLYLEESARYLLELNILDQEHSRQKLHLISENISFAPESLHDLFMSRLDRLTNEKWLVQFACAIGRQFEKKILKAVAQIDDELFESTLINLIDADIIYQVDGQSRQLYEFKHVLLRDAAHDALLRKQRQSIHQKIIDAYQQYEPQILTQQPELLAYHHSQAGNMMPAVLSWQLAGIKSQRLSANIEAVSHFRKALDMLPENQHADLRLELLIQIGPSLMAVESWASEEVKSIYSQSIELSEKKKDNRQLFTSLRGLWGNVFLTGNLHSAKKISKRLDQIASADHKGELKIESLLSQAMEAFWRGKFVQSQAYLNRVTQLYDQNLHREHAYIFSVDPGVVSLFYASRNLLYLGYPDASLRRVEASIKLAEKHEHYPSLTWGLGFYAAVLFAREEFTQAHEVSKRGIALSEEHNLQLWAAWGYVFSGCSEVFLDETENGLEKIKYGIKLYKKLGAGLALPFFYAVYAESLLLLGRHGKALKNVQNGLKIVNSHSIHSSAAELLLLKSRALYLKSTMNLDQAVDINQQALILACRQRARFTALKILSARIEMNGVSDRWTMAQLQQIYEHFKHGAELEAITRTKQLLASAPGLQ